MVKENEDIIRSLMNSSECMKGLGGGFSYLREKFDSLCNRLIDERFHLAVLGQFKRGKSTFLNALVGGDYLPSSVVPLTAVPTFIKPGEKREARIFFESGKDISLESDDSKELKTFLERYVAEEKNPKNVEGVQRVDLLLPSEILKGGVVLIDTPGIGSTFRHNTEVTLNFLSECDAALFMISADPPITEVEVEFLKAVKSKVSRLFFVVNKIDYLDGEELEQVKAFFRKMLIEQAGFDGDITLFDISSKRGLKARLIDDMDLWKKSGLNQVDSFLIDFLAGEKKKALEEAISRKALEGLSDGIMKAHLTLKSLEMPLADLEGKMKLFNEKVGEVRRSRQMMEDLLQGDRKRMVQYLEAQADLLRENAAEYLEGMVGEALGKASAVNNVEEKVKERVADSIPGFFERELGGLARQIDEKIAETLGPHEARIDDIVSGIREAAAKIFDIPYRSIEGSAKLEYSREPYWVTHRWSSAMSFVPDISIDRLMPAAMRYSRLKKRMRKNIEELVLLNVENLRWVTLQNLDQTFRKFQTTLNERLDETVTSTIGAIEAARQKRVMHAEQTEEEIARFSESLKILKGLEERFKALSGRPH